MSIAINPGPSRKLAKRNSVLAPTRTTPLAASRAEGLRESGGTISLDTLAAYAAYMTSVTSAIVAFACVVPLAQQSESRTPNTSITSSTTPPIVAAKPAIPTVEELTQIAVKSRARHEIPALVLAVVTKNGLESIAVDGVRVLGQPEAALATDRMHLGSCTKAFTATLAAVLVADGKIGWNSTIDEVLSKSFPNINEGWKSATLEDLLRHRSGASSFPVATDWATAFACNVSPSVCRNAFVQSMLERVPTQKRGKHVYSNQGYAIAGCMLEAVGGAAYEELLRTRVLTPLGISHEGFGPPTSADPASPKGHSLDGMALDGDNPTAIAPAATLHMPVGEWAKFIAFHLGGTPPVGLEGAAKELENLHKAGPDAPKEGLGWITARRDWGGDVLTHSGSNTQWYCTAWLAPERGFAVLAATNQGGERAQRACDESCSFAIKARNAGVASVAPAAPSAPSDATGSSPAPSGNSTSN